MSELMLTQHGNSKLYVPQEPTGFECRVWIAFYCCEPKDDENQGGQPNPPGPISIGTLWDDYLGYVLILHAEPPASYLDAFAARVAANYGSTPPANVDFVWMAYDTAADSIEEIAHVVTTYTEDDDEVRHYLTSGTEVIDFGGYKLPIDDKVRVLYSATAKPGAIWGEATGFVLEYPDPPSPKCPSARAVAQPDPMKSMYLNMTGERAGCLQATAVIFDYYSDLPSSWDVGLRYVAAIDGTDVEQFYPVFDPDGDCFPLLWMCWDPCDHLNPTRTFLTVHRQFVELSNVGEESCDVELVPCVVDYLPTFFRTVTGERIALSPVDWGADPAKLVFEMRWAAETEFDDDEYYLVPSGSFELVLVDGVGEEIDSDDEIAEFEPARFMCGLAGVESVEFSPRDDGAPGDRIMFFEHHAAYAPAYPVFGAGAVATGTTSPLQLLSCDYHTAWASIHKLLGVQGAGAVYCSQPEQGPLYSSTANGFTVADNRLLQLVEPVAEALPAPAAAKCFPIAPVAGTEGVGQEFVEEFEGQILSPFRRERILRFVEPIPCDGTGPFEPCFDNVAAHGMPGKQHDPGIDGYADAVKDVGTARATTPQGVIVDFVAGQWNSILVANNATTHTVVKFDTPDHALRAAFQSNQLFLVASKASHLQGMTANVNLGDWAFQLDVANCTFPTTNPTPATGFADLNNVLLVKFGPGSIAQRLQDTKAWTNPGDFNECAPERLQLLATRIRAFVAAARVKAANDAAYKRFVSVIDDEQWTGVVGLNVSIDVPSMPAELQFLAAGANQQLFVAHHVVVETGFVQLQNGSVVPADASSFALVDYRDDSENTSTEDVSFKLREFYLRFDNSGVLDYRSRVDLIVNRMFDEPVLRVEGAPQGAGNAIVIVGAREMHSAVPKYSFVVDGTRRFVLDSKVIAEVDVRKVEFVATSLDRSEPFYRRVLIMADFAFFGFLKFHSMSIGSGQQAVSCDLFSYDRLAFESLGLRYEVEIGDVPFVPDFNFIYERIAIDTAQGATVARSGSLVRNFPMRVLALRCSTGAAPTAQGFVVLRSPLDTSFDPLTTRWYGLEFELNLGTLGELAANAGIVVRVMLAWSPGGVAKAKAAAHLKFPGVGAANNDMMSIEGVVKLGASSYELVKVANGFAIRLKSYALRLLGLSLPVGGGPDIVIFSNPDQAEASPEDVLGWYAVYPRPL